MSPTRGAVSTGSPPSHESQPWLHQRDVEIQKFGTVRQFPIALSRDARVYAEHLVDTPLVHV